LKNQEAKAACMLPKQARYHLRYIPIYKYKVVLISKEPIIICFVRPACGAQNSRLAQSSHNFDRCAYSRSLHLPPAAFVLVAQSRGACNCATSRFDLFTAFLSSLMIIPKKAGRVKWGSEQKAKYWTSTAAFYFEKRISAFFDAYGIALLHLSRLAMFVNRYGSDRREEGAVCAYFFVCLRFVHNTIRNDNNNKKEATLKIWSTR